MGGYFYFPPINDFVGLVLSWCLKPVIVGGGEMFDELVKVYPGKLVSVSLCFFPIVNEFGETGALGCLGKYLEVVE